MPAQIPYLNVFLSSPGDVAQERAIARKIMKRLPNRPTFKGKVALNIIAWDDLDSATAMEASLTPQAAINKGLPMPSESDIVIVLFWSRMGTPFTDEDGTKYKSGTHWELLNALSSDATQTYIYRRMESPTITMDDEKFNAKFEQYQHVKDFFSSELFYKDGEIQMSVHQYQTPAEFEDLFDRNIEEIVLNILNDLSDDSSKIAPRAPIKLEIQVVETIEWDSDRSPFPGLRAFTEEDVDIFFGRSRETDELVKQVSNSQFVAVIGASGSGKSSLVGAGLIPQLRANAITGSKDWKIAQFKPNDDPFVSLAEALLRVMPNLSLSELLKSRGNIVTLIEDALMSEPDWVQVLIFIDQFEELFTLASEDDRRDFITALEGFTHSYRMKVVVTMRADFYHRAVEYSLLAEFLRNGSFPLAIPKRDALRQMIERPAERAGLEIEHSLVERILDDTGDEPGNLALMAYALDEIYHECKLDGQLTQKAYTDMGGLEEAIGVRAEKVFAELDGTEDEKQAILAQVFVLLVEVDERGTATRQRAPQGQFDDELMLLVKAFTDARLLVMDNEAVEVAHEALFRGWERLSKWIETAREDLNLWHKLQNAAYEWEMHGRPDYLLWTQERLIDVKPMFKRLRQTPNRIENDFIRSEVDRLFDEFINTDTPRHRKMTIIDRWKMLGTDSIKVVLQVIPSINHSDPDQINGIAEILTPYTDKIEPVLYKYLQSKSPITVIITIKIISCMNLTSSIPKLAKLLDKSNIEIRLEIISALKNLPNTSVIPILIKATHYEHWQVRRSTIDILADYDNQPSVQNCMIMLLADEDEQVKLAALQVLRETTEIIVPLKDIAHSEDIFMRFCACYLLWKNPTQQALSLLEELLGDTDEYGGIRICYFAASALAKIGTTETEEILWKWKYEFPPRYENWQKWENTTQFSI